MKPRLDTPDSPLTPHYAIMSGHRIVQVMPKDDEGAPFQTALSLDIDRINDMLIHHMAEFKRDAGELVIDGYRVPAKAAARLYIDAIATILGNHGIALNLAKIEAELCPKCHGNLPPDPVFAGNAPLTPEGIKHQSD